VLDLTYIVKVSACSSPLKGSKDERGRGKERAYINVAIGGQLAQSAPVGARHGGGSEAVGEGGLGAVARHHESAEKRSSRAERRAE
jgi:hypothetical protein